MPMLNPPHPGEVVRKLACPTAGAERNRRRRFGRNTQDAFRISEWSHPDYPGNGLALVYGFSGGSAESWLQQQVFYDLAQTRKKASNLNIKRFVPA